MATAHVKSSQNVSRAGGIAGFEREGLAVALHPQFGEDVDRLVHALGGAREHGALEVVECVIEPVYGNLPLVWTALAYRDGDDVTRCADRSQEQGPEGGGSRGWRAPR